MPGSAPFLSLIIGNRGVAVNSIPKNEKPPGLTPEVLHEREKEKEKRLLQL